ncbi:acyl-CoA dehydrogenase [Mycolicibacterium conceptionense]|uniref:Acyl-CoA dehydrogenase n=1 Tax=Mycolicibacterium conceptionense TaxID=451644 RepID=A0A0U1DSE0_9MYCO|nr:acyl-CoA dehydrogenase [Mycolicibacterium conceptionense]
MSSAGTYLKRPSGYDAELQSVFRPIFERIAEGNVARERDRVFPHEQVRWLCDAGFGTVRIPAEQGGFGASLEQTFLLLAELGEADANVAHIWRNHLAFVEDRLNAPVSEDNAAWIKRFLAGEFVGGGWTEANNLTLANLATTVTEEGDHWLVSGAKYYATGSLYADWLDVLGRGADGELWTAWCAPTIRASRWSTTGEGSASARQPAVRHATRRRARNRATSFPPPSGLAIRRTSIRSPCWRS